MASELDGILNEGLSPRVRGNRRRRRYPLGNGGSIPACAGEPIVGHRKAETARVYPRVCGGTPAGLSRGIPAKGLSPRVRGNRMTLYISRQSPGSIPACAGEPGSGPYISPRPAVYPRVCGGTNAGLDDVQDVGGLSPRVRGNLAPQYAYVRSRGSIPACAGEPGNCRKLVDAVTVYPRVCGGTSEVSLVSQQNAGLSPRVRGNPYIPCKPARLLGSIPACAGEPFSLKCRRLAGPVYPRVCGGTRTTWSCWMMCGGLSPHVRGNRPVSSSLLAWEPSIPACAGEPPPLPPPYRAGQVYPRMCGGNRCVWHRRQW